jgi:hypothetical protein
MAVSGLLVRDGEQVLQSATLSLSPDRSVLNSIQYCVRDLQEACQNMS